MKETGYTTLNKINPRNVTPPKPCPESDLVCLSHLRWDFVFQRPQHLMTRFARHRRVFYVEEAVLDETPAPYMEVSERSKCLRILTPHLPAATPPDRIDFLSELLLEEAVTGFSIRDFTLWYYTPMALLHSRRLNPDVVIYDCMDELSAFKNAS